MIIILSSWYTHKITIKIKEHCLTYNWFLRPRVPPKDDHYGKLRVIDTVSQSRLNSIKLFEILLVLWPGEPLIGPPEGKILAIL